jgi:hypothetical protein
MTGNEKKPAGVPAGLGSWPFSILAPEGCRVERPAVAELISVE